MSLFFEESGARTGNTKLLLIHGNSLSSKIFDFQIGSKELHDFNVFAVDLPGHGQSAPPSDLSTYSLDGYCQVLINWIEELILRNIILGGHSLGGHIATAIAAKRPDLLKGLILFGTPSLGNPPNMTEAFNPVPDLGLFYKPDLSEEELASLSEGMTGTLKHAPFIRKMLVQTDPNARSSFAASLANGLPDEQKTVQNLPFPVAYIHGMKDRYVNNLYMEHLPTTNMWRGGIQKIENSGHCPQLECPDSFNTILRESVDEVAGK